MKKRQIKLSLFSIIVIGLMFVGMQMFVPVDALAQEPIDDGSFIDEADQPIPPLGFYPVTPCRISDSRQWWAQGVYRGPFVAGQTICFDNYGLVAEIEVQGGRIGGCMPPAAVGEPGGFHVNIAAVPVSGRGHVRIWPANASRPTAAVLNWDSSVGNISNASSNDSWFSLAPGSLEFCIYIGGFGSTHIVMDVMGYFDE
jgi:hypothetical protein